MKVKAKIANFDFRPMVDVIPSILTIDIKTYRGEDIHFEFKDSIENLSKRFHFKIVSGQEWDFTNFIGKHCIVDVKENSQSKFIAMGDIL